VTDSNAQPLTLREDPDTGDRFLVYQAKDGVRAELRVEGDSFWVTQAQMATMFGVLQQGISQHIRNILSEGELPDDEATHKKFLLVRQEGERTVRREVDHYDLNVLISVGYRVSGPLGTMFRVWATDKLFQYLTKGFVIDVERLEDPDGRPDFFAELLEKIRHIRTSERRMWLRILELAEFCNDYDPANKSQHVDFFAEIQNTMHWAAHQHTAAELTVARVDAAKLNAGVMSFKGKMPTVAEAQTAKNVLGEAEITALEAITSLALEFFESQAEQRRPTTLAQFLEKMRELVKLDGRPLKKPGDPGKVSAKRAQKHAAEQVRLYKDRMREQLEAEGDKALAQLASKVRKKKTRKPRPKKN
jgi:hypothetical protein